MPEALPEPYRYRYVILNRDRKFDQEVLAFLAVTGLEVKRTSVQSPWPERWIGSCRREMLEHVITMNEEHLRRILHDYVTYHHEDRLHGSLEKDTPNRRNRVKRPSVNAEMRSRQRPHLRIYSWPVSSCAG